VTTTNKNIKIKNTLLPLVAAKNRAAATSETQYSSLFHLLCCRCAAILYIEYIRIGI
jgi:hypothetical protein